MTSAIKGDEYCPKASFMNNIYACTYSNCSNTFDRLYRYQRHLRKHLNEKPFICGEEGCTKAFTCNNYLKKHLKTHEKMEVAASCKTKEPKTYSCDECGKSFRQKFDLKVHSSEHTGDKPFKCDECDKEFALKSRLKRHKKMHLGYPCNREGCDYVAEKWSNLQVHVSKEHKLAHECETCKKRFTTSHNLNVHSKIHSEVVNRFICSYENCHRSYVSQSNLNLHLNSVHNNLNHACTFEGCEKKFAYKYNLKKHLKKHSIGQTEKSFKKKPNIIRKKTCNAKLLSGFNPKSDEIKSILTDDKEFLKETEYFAAKIVIA